MTPDSGSPSWPTSNELNLDWQTHRLMIYGKGGTLRQHQTCYAADRRLKPMDPATLRVIYGILAVVLLVLIILTRRKRLGR